MKDYEKDILAPIDTAPRDELTPSMRPAPMPVQTILFWTPRAALGAALRVMELHRLSRAPQPAAIAMTVLKSNEPR